MLKFLSCYSVLCVSFKKTDIVSPSFDDYLTILGYFFFSFKLYRANNVQVVSLDLILNLYLFTHAKDCRNKLYNQCMFFV